MASKTAGGETAASTNAPGDIDEKRKSSSRRAPKSTTEVRRPDSTQGEPEESDLHRQLYDSLRDCSRQRLRALQMTLRRNANFEGRVQSKDLTQMFQDCQIKMPSRTLQLLIDVYEDKQGVDYERMWRSLVKAQNITGRDSVLAQNKRNDLDSNQRALNEEERDADLVRRLQEQLQRSRDPYDLNQLRKAFKGKDTNKVGKLERTEMMKLCTENKLPIYGALLNSILTHCDDELKGQISWPDVMSFLDKAHRTLPAKAKRVDDKSMSRNSSATNVDRLNSSSGRGADAKPAGLNRTPKAHFVGTTYAMSAPLAKELVKQAFQKAVEDDKGKPGASKKGTSSGVAGESRTGSKKTSKAASGFLQSMKGYLKADEDTDSATVPLIKVDKNDRSIPEEPSKGVATKTKGGGTASGGGGGGRGCRQVEVSVKGKKVAFYVPDGYDDKKVVTDPPHERLKLEWVYGYRGHDCRANLHILGSGEIVYFIGQVAVLCNREKHLQRHYREHTAEIKSIAVHPNQITVATGQCGSPKPAKAENKAHVRVWRSDTLQTLYILGSGIVHKSVISLGFSKAKQSLRTTTAADGNKSTYSQDRLAVVDNNDDHMLSVWDLSKGTVLAQTPLMLEIVYGAVFNPNDPDMIVVIGKEHLGWWIVYPENNAIQLQRKADYQNNLRAKYVTCVMHTERGDVVTGDSNGTVYVWGYGCNLVTNLIKHAHDCPLLSMLLVRGTLLTAGRDGAIHGWRWGKNMDHMATLRVPAIEGGVRTLQLQDNQLLLGTTANSILSATLAGAALRNPLAGVTVDKVYVTQGHSDDVQGICAVYDSSKAGHIVTAGWDGSVCAYDTDKRRPVWKWNFKGVRISCVDINKEGTLLATGSSDCVVELFSIQEDIQDVIFLTELCSVTVGVNQLTTLKLSPDCTRIMAGDVDGGLHVVANTETEEDGPEWQLVATCKGHKGCVTGLDWSETKHKNVFVVRSSSSHAELCFWNGETCTRFDNDMLLRNMQWTSHQCKLGFPILGIWHSKQAQDANITAVDVNPKKTVVAMGDCQGYISMFRYPCTKKGVYCHVDTTPHPCVHDFRFTSTRMLTIGGQGVLQWLAI